jgi:hypothetical protein
VLGLSLFWGEVSGEVFLKKGEPGLLKTIDERNRTTKGAKKHESHE